MKLKPDAQFFPIGDDVVVFSEDAQNLLVLNSSAGQMAREIKAGASASQLEQEAVRQGVAPGEAVKWVTSIIDALGSYGMLIDVEASTDLSPAAAKYERHQAMLAEHVPAYRVLKFAAERRYRLLDTCTLIRFGALEQVAWINSVIGHLATDDSSEPTNVIEIHYSKPNPSVASRNDVYCNQERAGHAVGLNQLGPVVKGVFWSAAINAHDYLFYIHAGVVGTGQSSILLPAEPGSGKTSLAAALRRTGFQYYSDEAALIERSNFQVRALPLGLCVKSTGWDVIAPYYPSVLTNPTHERSDGKIVRYVLPRLTPEMEQPCLPVGHIIFPRYAKDEPTELSQISASAALRRLMAQCLTVGRRLDSGNVEDLVRWIAGIECYTLTFSSLDEATRQIIQLSGFTRAQSRVS